MNKFIADLEYNIINNHYSISEDEALELYNVPEAQELYNAAFRITRSCSRPDSPVCSIINAKQGSCSENCRYCAQSAHWNTGCKTTGTIEPEQAAKLAQKASAHQVDRLSLVTSGRALKGKDFDTMLDCYQAIKAQRGDTIELCASAGLLDRKQMVQLKEAGVSRYHHNLEACRNYYPSVCTTHTYDDRIRTIQYAKDAGLEICCGGIVGLGESRKDRVELALEIRELDVQSVPINILTPIPGTPLEHQKPLSKEEILRTFAVFRFIMPATTIRCAAGRLSLGNNGEEAFRAGADALISGDLLTVAGSSNLEDLKMLERLGFLEI